MNSSGQDHLAVITPIDPDDPLDERTLHDLGMVSYDRWSVDPVGT